MIATMKTNLRPRICPEHIIFKGFLVFLLCAVTSGCDQILSELVTQEPAKPAVSAKTPTQAVARQQPSVQAGLKRIVDAYKNSDSDFFTEGRAQVVRVLKDDTEGDQHQRFIVQVAPGHTVLVSHNIDLAPRVNGLAPGDWVSFRGEYVWNNKGGVIHWTHHDPRGRYEGGWIEYKGKKYR